MKPSDTARQIHRKIDWASLQDLRGIDGVGECAAEVLKGIRHAGIDDFISPAILQQICFIQAGKKYCSTPYKISKSLQEFNGALERSFDQSRKYRFPKSIASEVTFNKTQPGYPDALLINICERFHRAVVHLTHRRKGRSIIDFSDEYDVQDVFGTVIKCSYQNVQDEVWTPPYAGRSARIDFVIEDIKTAVEIKRVRSQQEIDSELIIDTAHYAQNKNVETLVCFVYDPDGVLRRDASQIEKDLSGLKIQNNRQINVTVLIRPK
ncbi:MAG TPA: hypothetical protein VGN23_12240 [Verrucomicrobiae bacterium]|jgi:hypothetical protein